MGAFSPDITTVLGPVLRLAVKYEVTQVQEVLMAALEELFPGSLEVFDAQQAKLESACQAGDVLWNEGYPEPASGLMLASEMSLVGAQRAALYSIIRLTPQSMRTRRSAAERDAAAGMVVPDLQNIRQERTLRADLLDAMTLQDIYAGRDEVLKLTIANLSLKSFQCGFCYSLLGRGYMENCDDAAKKCLDHILLATRNNADILSVLSVEMGKIHSTTKYDKFCPPCKRHAVNMMTRFRRFVWSKIDHIFGLYTGPDPAAVPSWDDEGGDHGEEEDAEEEEEEDMEEVYTEDEGDEDM